MRLINSIKPDVLHLRKLHTIINQSAATLLTVFFLVSCASLKSKQEFIPTEKMKEELQTFCFSGAGKGRLDAMGPMYSFSFESLLDREKSYWLIGLDFPVHGQEDLKLNWSSSKFVAEGSLPKRIQSSYFTDNTHTFSNEKVHAILDRFFRVLGVFFKQREDVLAGRTTQMKDFVLLKSGSKLFVKSDLDKDYRFIVSGEKSSSTESFERVRFAVESKKTLQMDTSAVDRDLWMDLFFDQCSK